MFPNAVLEDGSTWNTILDAMIKVRDAQIGLNPSAFKHSNEKKYERQKTIEYRIGGGGFMGRTHSNGYKRVNDFFGDLAYRPYQGHLRQK